MTLIGCGAVARLVIGQDGKGAQVRCGGDAAAAVGGVHQRKKCWKLDKMAENKPAAAILANFHDCLRLRDGECSRLFSLFRLYLSEESLEFVLDFRDAIYGFRLQQHNEDEESRLSTEEELRVLRYVGKKFFGATQNRFQDF